MAATSTFLQPFPSADDHSDVAQKKAAILLGEVVNGTRSLTTSASGGGGAGAHTLASSSVSSDGTVAAGAFSVTFLPSSDFVGTIDGLSYPGSAWTAISFQADSGRTLPAIAYTRSAGTLGIVKLT